MTRAWTIRHHIARWMIHTALRIMPSGRYRSELNAALWTLGMQVQATVAMHNGQVKP